MSAILHDYIDAIGNKHYPVCGDYRIVSLVPSLTELLFDLGLENFVVGRTGFCIHPNPSVNRVLKVGGTKVVKIDVVRKLEPTHLVVNIDENRRETVEEIAKFVPHIVVTHPCKPADNIELYKLFGGIFRKEKLAEVLASELRTELSHLQQLREQLPKYHVLYLIWRNPWMSVSRETYISSMLDLINWVIIEPAGNKNRYPVIGDIKDMAGKSDMILLSSEPYPFRKKHIEECRNLAPMTKTMLVDGELLSWYGSRAVSGLRYLARLAKNNMLDSDIDPIPL